MTQTTQHTQKTAAANFERLRKAAQYAKGALMTSGEEHYLLVDGSQFSPSSRAIGTMESAWQTWCDDDWFELDEALDELIQGYESNGWTMGWDEGCLFLYSPDYDHEAS